MIDIQDRKHCPILEEIGEYVNNPLFTQFCTDIKAVSYTHLDVYKRQVYIRITQNDSLYLMPVHSLML